MERVKLFITALIYGTGCYSFYDANTLLFRHLLLNNSATFVYCFFYPHLNQLLLHELDIAIEILLIDNKTKRLKFRILLNNLHG